MVAVGGYDLNAQIEWIKECNHLSIHAFLLGSPIYAKPGPVGQEQWFKALLDAAERPCMLYNVPSRSCVELEVSVLQALQMHPNCWALKEASGDLNKFLQYRKSCPELELYSGEDAMVPYLVSADVKGLVSVCANVWPVETNRYVEMALAHQHQTLFPVWHNAITALFQVANPIPVKILMHKLNLINSAFLRPPLYVNELSDTDELITSNQKIQSWFSQNQPNMTDLDTMIDNHLHIKNKA
jgi:4-hydroxy-tetrahydrodipicolinate synthase